jgi:hypothetical protein
MFKKACVLALCTILLAIPLAGCGNGESAGTAKTGKETGKGTPSIKTIDNEPLTLKVYQNGLAVTDADFENFFVKNRKRFQSAGIGSGGYFPGYHLCGGSRI